MPENKPAMRRLRRSPLERVRSIEYGRRAPHSPAPGYAKYVGRVGALAVALGVGSGLAAMPLAFADTTGSAGSTGSTSSGSRTCMAHSVLRLGGLSQIPPTGARAAFCPGSVPKVTSTPRANPFAARADALFRFASHRQQCAPGGNGG